MRALTIKPVLLTAVVTMSLLSPAVWAAAAGKVTYAYGQAQAVNAAAQARPLVKGAEVQSGESVQTQQGRAQITFSDGGFVALQPNTAFKIDDYDYAGREDGSEHSFLNLLKGGMRFVTGAIGHRNKQNYKIKTVVATIGIRGSGGLAHLCVAGSCPDQKDGLYLTGNQDVLTLTNEAETKDVHPGESFYVGCSNCVIQQVEQTPVAHVDVKQGQSNPQDTFVASEQRTDTGASEVTAAITAVTGPVGRFIGVVQGPGTLPPNPPDDGFVSTLNGTVSGNPPNFIKFNGTLPPGQDTQAAFFNGTVTDFFTFAGGAFMFRWTDGAVTKFNPDGSIRGTDVLGPNAGYSFIVGTGPQDPLPSDPLQFHSVAVYDFVAGTHSTQDGAVTGTGGQGGTKNVPGGIVGQGITGGSVFVDFFSGGPDVGVNFTVVHSATYFVSGSGIPLDTGNGTFSTFNGGSVSASGSRTCSGCQVDIVGSLEGPGVTSLGNAPEGLGLGYRIRDNGFGPTQGPQNWIKGVGAFELNCFGPNCVRVGTGGLSALK